MEERTISFIAHESAMARMERINVRQFIVIVVLILLLFGSNAAWLAYESQFEDILVTQEVDSGNGDAIVAGVGDVNYGESKTDSQSQTP